ncbi:hypothetical protein [Microbacterium sp. P04]|uniref:hypothetical protein n=1 Tax=Microbacterium sp. P04 TaxID=3366947 RepID=UPI003744CDE4
MAIDRPAPPLPGSPPPVPPATAVGPAAAGIARFAWAVWPWMSWLLPVFLVLRGFISGSGGWEALILLFASPVLVPVLGLLGMLPWFLLRRRGWRSTPAPVIWLLFLNWWGWFGFIITIRGIGDSGDIPSMLVGAGEVRLSQGAEQALLFVCLLLAAGAWVAILVIVLAHPRVSAAAYARWTVVAWIAAIAVPVLLIAGVLGATAATTQQRDAAGDTVAEVESQPIDTQLERAEARYDELQRMLVPLRESFGTSGWEVYSSGFSDYAGSCSDAEAECYSVEATFTLDAVTTGASAESFADLLRSAGWETEQGGYGANGEKDGYVVDGSIAEDGSVWLELSSPTWWGDPSELRQALGEIAPRVEGELYASDEWPSLR